jgi:DNA repair protein RadC
MNRTLLLAHLAQVERHIREGERHLSRQREIVAELERHGRGHSRTTQMARDLLDSFEMAQSAHLNDRAHLLQALRAQPQRIDY